MEATGHVDPSIAVNTAKGGMTMQQLSQILRLAYHATQFGDPHLPPFNYRGPTSAFAEVVGVLADLSLGRVFQRREALARLFLCFVGGKGLCSKSLHQRGLGFSEDSSACSPTAPLGVSLAHRGLWLHPEVRPCPIVCSWMPRRSGYGMLMMLAADGHSNSPCKTEIC